MVTTPTVSLRPALTADYPLIETWLRRTEVQRWWVSLSAAQASVISALQEPMGLCSIILVDGVPAGYIQAQEDGTPDIAGGYRMDAFIGEPSFRGQGVASKALELAADEVFHSTLALAIVAFIPIRIEAAVRLYERAGFKWVRIVEEPLLGSCWLLRRERA